MRIKRVLLLAAIIMTGMAVNAYAKQDPRHSRQLDENYNVYWGDLHNHSALTYGHGSFANALENAAEGELDFFTVTPHAMWPDIEKLRGNKKLEWVIAYHTNAFKKLRNPAYWQNYIDKMKEYNIPGKRITFPTYEVHSLKYGDHVVISKYSDISLPKAKTSVVDLRDHVLDKENTIISPHGVGYQSGFRGYNWDYFKESPQTPFAEIFSRHGNSEGSVGPFGMYHDMGPRDFAGTVEAGLRRGLKFGIMASSDSHAGHPGSYGGGRVAALASSLSRDAIWEALRARRVYASTGANITLDFRINKAYMGEEIKDNLLGRRKVHVAAEGVNQIDYVELIKNGKTIRKKHANYTPDYDISQDAPMHAKIKFEFGWNQVSSKDRVEWKGSLSLSGGKFREVIPQFRGAPFTSPQKDLEGKEHAWESWVSRITEKSARSVSFHAFSISNPAPSQPTTQSILLDVYMRPSDTLIARINGKIYRHTLAELLEGSRGHFMQGWLSESILFNRAVPKDGYRVSFDFTDRAATPEDYYFVRVRQTDHQWAWSSPIWVARK